MSTREVSVGGVLLTLSTPYAEGHTINEAEAKALNQTRIENISNSLRKRIAAEADAEGNFSAEALAKIAAFAAEYDASYAFTLSGTGGARRAIDPLERECIAVARAAITAQLKREGRKAKDIPAETMDELIERHKNHPKIVKLAKERLAEREKLAGLDFDVG